MVSTHICRAFVAVLAVVFGVAAAPAGGQTMVFVDAAATGAGNGGSWDDAYTSVQPALDAATGGQQVWVAAGAVGSAE